MIIIIVLFLTILYFLYWYTFGVDPKRTASDDEVPVYKVFQPYTDALKRNVKEIQDAHCQKLAIRAKDGTVLFGKYYHLKEGAPIMLMFHGYRSSAMRDSMGAFRICKEEGYNILMVDQRGHRESGGKAITFGIKERYDCLDWISHVLSHFGKDKELILVGLSMGAATVLMASGLELPENVKGIIADCGYSTPRDVIGESIKRMKLPVKPVYMLVRLSAILFGGFDPDSATTVDALAKCKVPVLLIHGERDHMVPYSMSLENQKACKAEIELFSVEEADHGMAYLVDENGYVNKVKEFLKRNLK